jgi:hypothetical protein
MTFYGTVIKAQYTPAKVVGPIENCYPSDFDYEYDIEPLELNTKFEEGEEIKLDLDGNEIEVLSDNSVVLYKDSMILEVDSDLEEKICEVIREKYTW